MPFTPRTWADGAVGGTAIDAANLNRMEAGIDLAVAAVEDATQISSDTRAEVEAELVAGSNITITPSGSGATRQLTIASTGGGGGGGSAPTLRGSSQATSGAASYTIALPGGSAAGDTAYLVVGSGNNVLVPTGFAQLRSQDALAGWGAGIFTKVLDAADITAGTVTVNTQGAFSSEAVLVVYQGTISGVVYLDYQQLPAAQVARHQNKDQAFPFQLTTADDLLIFQTTRANTAMTSSIGTLLQNHQQANGSISVYRYPVTTAGVVIGSVNIPAAGFEFHFIRLAVRG